MQHDIKVHHQRGLEYVVKQLKKVAAINLEQIQTRLLDAAQRDEFKIFNTSHISPHIGSTSEYGQSAFDSIAHRMRTLPGFLTAHLA